MKVGACRMSFVFLSGSIFSCCCSIFSCSSSWSCCSFCCCMHACMVLAAKNFLCSLCFHTVQVVHVAHSAWSLSLPCCLFFAAPSFSAKFVTLSCFTHSCCLRWHSAGTELQQHKEKTLWQWICCRSSVTTGSACSPLSLSLSLQCVFFCHIHTHTLTQTHSPAH